MDEEARGRLKRLLHSLSDRTIQEVPPELYGCEICRRTDCCQDEWIVCENRIAHAKCLAEHQVATGTEHRQQLDTALPARRELL